MEYQSDNGKKYAVLIDESNGKLGEFVDIPNGVLTASQTELPKGMKMRYVNMVHMATGTTRKLPLGRPGHPLISAGGSRKMPLYSGSGVQMVDFVATSYVGEKTRRIFGEDSGLNDGDAS